jgi:PadR family transcriptional regulator PadR
VRREGRSRLYRRPGSEQFLRNLPFPPSILFYRYTADPHIAPPEPAGTPLAYRGESLYLILGNRWASMSKPSDLVQGTLDLLLLKILALEPLNGFAISQRLKQISGDVLQVSDGSLYPALHKLEQEGWITAEWKPSENNRRAKFYSLTRPGRRQLEREAGNWNRLSAAISHVVKLEEA